MKVRPMVEIYPDIYCIKERGGLSAIKPEVNIYIIAGNDGLMFDAGYGTRKAVDHLVDEINSIKDRFGERGLEFGISRVMPSHSHPDHFSGLRRIRKRLGCRVMLTDTMSRALSSYKDYSRIYHVEPINDYLVRRNIATAAFGKVRGLAFNLINKNIYGMDFLEDPDEIVPDNSEIMINGESWCIFPSPGHASDHISLYNENRGVLLGGDNILRTITTWLGPPDSSLSAYMKSLEFIASLKNLNIILGAHGSPVADPRKRIREILEHRKKRIIDVMDIVSGCGRLGASPEYIIKKLYGSDGMFKKKLSRGWIVLTLRYLEEKGLVTRYLSRGTVFFVKTGYSDTALLTFAG